MPSRALFVCAVLTLFCPNSYAQTALATLVGSVTDQTGASIYDAKVTALHLDTGTSISGASSATGIFTLTQLPLGKYEIQIKAPGFQTFNRSGVTLSAAQVLRVDATLIIGPVEGDSVDVEATLLKTDTSEVVHNITVSQIQNLPLTPINTGYVRDPLQLVQLLPGIRYNPQAYMIVNGLPPDAVQYRVDGQVIGNSRAGGTSLTVNVQPSVDAIQEVAIQTSNYSAEFGSVAGALFNFTMKSGTNQYHGSAFDYAANEALNAYNPGLHTRDRIRRHDWGGTIGGPITIPKIYDGKNKTFFFFTWERFDQSTVNAVTPTGFPTVPTPAYRSGDFSGLLGLSGNRNLAVGARDYKDPLGNTIAAGTLFDPNSTRDVICNTALSSDCGANGATLSYRTPLAGNRIPATMFDPVAAAILNKYIPLPQGSNAAAVANNYYAPIKSQKLTVLPSIKFDHNLSKSTRITFLHQQARTTSPQSNIGGYEGFNPTITINRGQFEQQYRSVLNADHTFTPTLQGHLGIGWMQQESSDRALVTDFNPADDIGLKGVKLNRNFPRFAATTAQTATGTLLGGMNAMGPALQQSQPERRPSANLSLTWIKNNHTIKIGGEWRMDMLPNLSYSNTAGNFGSSGFQGITSQPVLGSGTTPTGVNNTGFAFADWLLGSVRTFSMSTPIAFRTSKQQWGLYVEDTWRATRKLTVEYGLRWDLGTYAREDHGRNATFGPTVPNPSAGGRAGALIYEGTCKCNIAQVYPYAVGPRLGVAYNFNSKTVVRGGFGVAYNSTTYLAGLAANSASAPSLPVGFDNFKLRDGIPASINPVWPSFDPAVSQLPGQVLPTPPAQLLDPNAGRPARTYQWNLSLQREITRNLVIEAAYVANRGVWQSAPLMVDLNAVSVQQLARYGFTVGNNADADLLNTRLDQVSVAQRSVLNSRGVVLPYSNFPTAQTVLQSIRPFPQYSGALNSGGAPLGRSWYDSLQITATKRYSHGLLVNMNYTLSKNLVQQGALDVFNRSIGKTYSSLNAPQQLRISFEYQVPRFSSGAPIVGNKWANNVISGWGLAAVLRYTSGQYVSRPSIATAYPVSRWLGLGRGPGGAQLKKNSDGSYMNPWSVDWFDNSGKHRTDPLDINCHCFDPEKTIVFNPAVWQAVPDGQWAADASQLPFFRTQRVPNESANLSRNFGFGKDRRYKLQVRVEFQNIFNRVSLPSPSIAGLTLTGATAQAKSPDGRYISGFGTFGNLRSGIGYSTPRSGMLVARFTF